MFAEAFADYDTILVGGAEEPLYQPGWPHRIVYTRDYFRSALHEVAHWCVAGTQRRQLEDYGYWYAPDGRNAEQQAEFERVELLPQALEKIFCEACGHPFRVSLDNLQGVTGDERRFSDAVDKQVELLASRGLPQRAARWVRQLGSFYIRS